MMKNLASKSVLLSAAALMLLAGCGGGGGGSTPAAGAATVSTGTVTGFGSVYVNGVEYKTAGSSVHLPDVSTTAITLSSSETEIQNHLKIGMQVRVKGSSDGTSGHASEIEFKDNMEGKVTATTASTLTVLGVTVNVDANTKIYSSSNAATTLAAIVPGTTWVEVSGVPDQTGAFTATYIGLKSSTGTEQELKGYVVADNGATFNLGFAVGISSVTINAPLAVGLTVGNYVEVKYDAAGTFINVELKNDLVKEDANTARGEAEGYVTAFSSTEATISVLGTPKTVKLVAGTAYYFKSTTGVLTPAANSDLAVGKKISAEGPVANGVITAAKVKIRNY
jgi:hypothetical protein